jgi:general secretion pathway protein B
MSYILEALRRSQAERERGQVPGLHAQPATLAPLPAPAENPPWRWLLPLALLLLGALGLALWAWPGRLPPGGPGAPAGGQTAAPAAQAVAPAAPPTLPEAPLPQVVSAPPAPVVAPAPAPTPAPAPVQVVPPGPAKTGVPPAAMAPPSPAPAPPAPATPRTLRLAELSAEQRRELPPLNLGGAVWSESALSRFVIVNGQVVREGDAAAPGVVVERIAPKAVLLRWREMLLEVPI